MNVRTIIAAAYVIAALLFSTSVSAGAIVSDKQPFSAVPEWFPDGPACIEPVLLDGWIQTVTRTDVDSAGGLHYVSKVTVHATGTGLFWGTQYQWNDTFQNVIANPAGTGYQEMEVGRTHLISQGQEVNGHVWWTAKFSITPDGNVTVAFRVIEIECY